jgi:hypothetical protein
MASTSAVGQGPQLLPEALLFPDLVFPEQGPRQPQRRRREKRGNATPWASAVASDDHRRLERFMSATAR